MEKNKELLKSTFKYQIPSVLEIKCMLRKLTRTSQIDQILEDKVEEKRRAGKHSHRNTRTGHGFIQTQHHDAQTHKHYARLELCALQVREMSD